MSEKKILYKVRGNKAVQDKYRSERTGLSAIELRQHDERFNKITYKEKPKGYWPETEDIEIDGVKR